MLRIVLIRSACTEFDQQERVQGSLDLPLSLEGQKQANDAAIALSDQPLSMIYSAPDKAATQTAAVIGSLQRTKVRDVEALSNIDLGLWHGKLVSEIKQQQPKVYRQWQEHPETVCPPEGETLQDAKDRIGKCLQKIAKKYKDGMVGLVVSEPLASLVQSVISGADELGDLWQGTLHCGQWIVLDVVSDNLFRVTV